MCPCAGFRVYEDSAILYTTVIPPLPVAILATPTLIFDRIGPFRSKPGCRTRLRWIPLTIAIAIRKGGRAGHGSSTAEMRAFLHPALAV